MSLKTMTPERLAYVRKDMADPIPRDDESFCRVWAGRARELLAELDAQLAAHEWQPIETAPKDGTEFEFIFDTPKRMKWDATHGEFVQLATVGEPERPVEEWWRPLPRPCDRGAKDARTDENARLRQAIEDHRAWLKHDEGPHPYSHSHQRALADLDRRLGKDYTR